MSTPGYAAAYYAANRDKVLARVKTWQKEHPGVYRVRNRANRIRHRYGLTPAEVRDHLVGQAGRCAICARVMIPGNGTHIDHDHDTGRFRGLLCSHCNHVLGFAKDRPDVLQAAIRYLERAAAVQG